MPIKRRTQVIRKPLYSDYRADAWKEQADSKFSARESAYKDGEVVTPLGPYDYFLVPKPIFAYKDVWHCGSNECAKELAAKILGMPDVYYVEVKARYVNVDYVIKGDHTLPRQEEDPRTRVRGVYGGR